MIVIATILFTVLTIIALLHVYWALGGFWPGHNELSLIRRVVGAKGGTKMPPRWLTALVAILIFLSGLFPLMWIMVIPSVLPAKMLFAGMCLLLGVFFLRGAITYTPINEKMQLEEPFATLNLRYYSPLCLIIGFGFLLLLIA